ncbi:MAG TPA: hypothetical protein VND62_04085 [Acidimicrobiales bacterium]|nr:hypothetical protein [Acidimicrobiales bacterium]
MQHRQVENERWTRNTGVDEVPRAGRGPMAAIRRFFAALGGGRAASEGDLDPAAALVPRPAAPRSLASAPPPPTNVGGLFDTRLAREVRGLVHALGPSRGLVAAALEAAGVRAAPGDPGRSPVVLFLSAVVGADPGVKSIAVGGGAVVVELRAWWRPMVAVALPAVVEDFTRAFDAGCYPALLRPEHRPGNADHGQGDPERAG